MRLGYISEAALDRAHQLCFNEAEAHAPRIRCLRLWRSILPRTGFNEAEAHAPRIHACGHLIDRILAELQ